MTLVLRIIEDDVEKTLGELVLSHDRDETQVIMEAFDNAGVEIPDVVTDPYFYLQLAKSPDRRGMVKIGQGQVSEKTARVILLALEAFRTHVTSNSVSGEIMNLETMH